MNVAAVRAGLAANLATIAGMGTSATVPDNVSQLPFAFVNPPELLEPADFDGGVRMVMSVVVLVSRVDTGRGQDLLDGYLSSSGPQSGVAAIYSDRTLGGAANDVAWTSTTDYGATYTVGTVPYIGAQINLEVLG